MRNSGFPIWLFAAIFIIIGIPRLAAWLPMIFFAWFVLRIFAPSRSKRRSSRKRENPYEKKYRERNDQYRDDHDESKSYRSNKKKYRDKKDQRRGDHDEPKSYRPKNYRYDEPLPSGHSKKVDKDLENPWKKKSKNEPKEATDSKPKHTYKAAPIKKSEQQNFFVYFIPILFGALVASILMQFGFDKLLVSILGVVLTLGLFAIMFMRRGKKQKETLSTNGLVIIEGRKQVTKIVSIAESVTKNRSIQWEIQEISRIVDELYDNFEEDPSDIDRARNFIKYNLPEAISLMQSYAKVSGKPNLLGEQHQQIKKAEEAIIITRESFQKLQQDLLENDLMDLEVQSRTLKGVLQNSLAFMGESNISKK